MKGILSLLGLVALLSTGKIALAATLAPDRDALAQDILANLEVNTFRNSLHPVHFPEGTTLGKTPFHIAKKVEGDRSTWQAIDEERTWIYSVTVIQSDQAGVTICFGDHSLVGTYRASSPLLVKKNSSGNYVVLRELPDIPVCVRPKG